MFASLLDALSCNTTCTRHVISTKAHPSCTTKQHEKATSVEQLLTPVSCPDRTTLATGFDLDLNDLTTSSSSTSSWPDQVIPALQPLDAYGTKFDTGDYLEDTQTTYYVTTNLPLSAPKGQTGPSPSLSIAQCDGFKGNQGDGMRSADPSGHSHTGPMGPVNAQTTTTTTTRSSQDITENNNTKASTWPTTTNQVYEGEPQLQAKDGYEPANNGHQPIAYEGTNNQKGPLGRVEQDDSMILTVQKVNDPVADGLLHLIFNHAPSSRIKKTLEMTEEPQCRSLPPDYLLDEVDLEENQYEDYDSDEDDYGESDPDEDFTLQVSIQARSTQHAKLSAPPGKRLYAAVGNIGTYAMSLIFRTLVQRLAQSASQQQKCELITPQCRQQH